MPDPSTDDNTTAVETVEAEVKTEPSEQTGSQPVDESGEKPSEIHSALVNAIQGKEPEPKTETPPAAEAETKADDKSPETDDKEAAQEAADKLLPFHEHPRWKEIYGANKELTAKVGTLEADIADAKPSLEFVTSIETFMDHNGLSSADFDRGLTVMAMIKKDPEKAIEVLRPILEDLEIATGKRLPEDVEKQVEDGDLSTEAAAELVRLRRGAAVRERSDTAKAETERAQALQRQVTTAVAAVSELERTWKGSDPDYKGLAPRVAEKFELWLHKVIQTGKLPTAQEATAKATEFRDAVRKEVAQFRPRDTRPNNPVTPGRPSAQAGLNPQPKTLHSALAQRIMNLGK